MALCRRENNSDNRNGNGNTSSSSNNPNSILNNKKQEQIIPTIKDPPHPLLSHLGLGDHVKTTVAFYDHLTLIHVHIAPLVVTILASSDPNTNIGAIKLIAVPYLCELLEPVKISISRLRYKFINGGASGNMMMMQTGLADSSSGYYHG